MRKHVLMAALIALAGCGKVFSPAERTIISRSDDVMYLTVIDADSAVLRTPSRDLTPRELRSDMYKALTSKMLSTVTSPRQDGVGIAAPQVGLDFRVAAVQRFDKPGEPFEVYANLRILEHFGDTVRGPEGCLSVPPMRGIVPRSDGVIVSYVVPETLETVVDTVVGYTAIIFQHETDHLDGRLYIDRADTVFRHASWEEERAPFAARGEYDRPAWWPF